MMRYEPLMPENGNPVHKYGIYSKFTDATSPTLSNVNNSCPVHDNNVSGIVNRVDGITLNDSAPVERNNKLTQGDKLNQMKARRCALMHDVSNTSTVNSPSPAVVPTVQLVSHL